MKTSDRDAQILRSVGQETVCVVRSAIHLNRSDSVDEQVDSFLGWEGDLRTNNMAGKPEASAAEALGK